MGATVGGECLPLQRGPWKMMVKCWGGAGGTDSWVGFPQGCVYVSICLCVHGACESMCVLCTVHDVCWCTLYVCMDACVFLHWACPCMYTCMCI